MCENRGDARPPAGNAQEYQAASHLAAIIHSSEDAIISKDLSSIVTSWNRSAERIFGYSAAEMVGKSITILFPPDKFEEEARFLERIRRGETVGTYETLRRRKDGVLIDVSLTVSPIRDGNGEVIGASKIVRDITAQRETEERLRQAQKMEAVGQLAGGIAHDFNNILTAINGFADIALQISPRGSDLQAYLEEIRRAGERATSLTQQLLAYSRKQMRSPKVIDLNAVVSEMDRLLRRVIGADIELQTCLEKPLGRVKADSNQMQQVILNLVLNARDAMPQGGKLVLGTANVGFDGLACSPPPNLAPSRHVMLMVSDTGVGMSPEVRKRLFEPFFTTKETGKGTGLGLPGVQGIVTQSGGSITVESEPGKGTTFRVYLPEVDAPLAREKSASGRNPSLDAASIGTLLLAEDEDAVRRFLAATLRNQGYEVLEAADGEQALEIGRLASCLDLLITDAVMPRMNGAKLMEELKPVHPSLKTIMMSGYTKDVLPSQFTESQDLGFLPKPFSQADLLKKVQAMFRKPAG